MDSLFDNLFAEEKKLMKPLADRMRPRTLNDFIGQEKAVGVGSPLRRMIEKDALQSVLFMDHRELVRLPWPRLLLR